MLAYFSNIVPVPRWIRGHNNIKQQQHPEDGWRCRVWETGTWARPKTLLGSEGLKNKEKPREKRFKNLKTSPLLLKVNRVFFNLGRVLLRSVLYFNIHMYLFIYYIVLNWIDLVVRVWLANVMFSWGFCMNPWGLYYSFLLCVMISENGKLLWICFSAFSIGWIVSPVWWKEPILVGSQVVMR